MKKSLFLCIASILASYACTDTEAPTPTPAYTGATPAGTAGTIPIGATPAGMMTAGTPAGMMTAGTPAGMTTTCMDLDLDGYFDKACNPNVQQRGGDCDDMNNLINPGRTENCGNAIDNDCDGKLPANDPDCSQCADLDNDGFQSATCNSNRQNGGDCDEQDPQVNPRGMERCGNMKDDDCQGGDLPCLPNCTDMDGDGFGQGAGCLGQDCNDNDAKIFPWQIDVCGDGVDQNCDGNDAQCRMNCMDADKDGYGAGMGCIGVDCNDQDPFTNPAAVDFPSDNIDQDCSGRDSMLTANCIDVDRDGYGSGSCPMDCNDSDPRINAGRREICGNGIDDDCNGSDTPCVTQGTGACVDMDGDGYGSGGCPRGGPDCNDNDRNINPGAVEACNSIDDNCNNQTDECGQRNQVCEGNRCIGQANAPCNNDTECSSTLGLVCDSGSRQCRVGPGELCANSESCISSAECISIFECTEGNRCYQKEGASCENDCDCTGAFLCNDINRVCVECVTSAQCQSPDDTCTPGGFCVQAYVGLDSYLSLTTAFIDCFNRYRGSNHVEGCGQVLMESTMTDFNGNPINSFPKADDVQDFICSDEASAYFSDDDYDTLSDLFGCGLFDIYNIWLINDIVPLQEFCIYYAPNKSGFSGIPSTHSEVVVIDDCNLSLID